jgi:hypothetical protein
MKNRKRIALVAEQWFSSTVLGIGLASLLSDLSHEAVTSVLPALLASMGAAAGALGTIEAVSDGLSSLAKHRFRGKLACCPSRTFPRMVCARTPNAGKEGSPRRGSDATDLWPSIRL